MVNSKLYIRFCTCSMNLMKRAQFKQVAEMLWATYRSVLRPVLTHRLAQSGTLRNQVSTFASLRLKSTKTSNLEWSLLGLAFLGGGIILVSLFYFVSNLFIFRCDHYHRGLITRTIRAAPFYPSHLAQLLVLLWIRETEW